jgi:DNA-binding LacI/PurR family transcriptional regulator
MGECAVVLFCDFIDQGKGKNPQIVVPFRLVERESVKKRTLEEVSQ